MTLKWACEPFAGEDDVINAPDGCVFDTGDDIAGFIDQASDILFQLTAGRVHGLCTHVVFPMTNRGCFDFERRPTTYFDGWLGGTIIHNHNLGFNAQFNGKTPVVLPNDATKVTKVTIDGTVLAPADYLLVNGQYLIRRAGAWPLHNDFTQPSGLGTWTVEFTTGETADVITRSATVQVAIELAKSFGIGHDRGFGPGVVSANVQGVQVTVEDLVDAVRAGRMAIPALDRFLGIYAPAGRETADVYSPELTTYDLIYVDFAA